MAVLLAALLAVFLLINGKWTEDDSTDTGDSEKTYTVSILDSASIKSISYTNDGKEYSFTLDGSEWKYDADENFPLDSDSVAEFAEALSAVEAEKEIEGKPTDSAEYGLDVPTHIIRVTCKDGSTYTYNIGDYNRHSGLYYLSYDKSDKVYMVSSSFASVFTLEEDDLMVLEAMDSISSDSVSKIVAEGAFGKITLDVTSSEEDGAKTYTHTNAEGGIQTLDEDGAVAIIKALSAPSLTKCADYYAEDGELEKYGLVDGERTKITISYSVKVTTTNDSTGEQNTSTMNKECVYYIGKALVETEKEDAEDTLDLADTSTDSTSDSTDNNEAETDMTEKTYLVLENSRMIFEVSLSSADSFFGIAAD